MKNALTAPALGLPIGALVLVYALLATGCIEDPAQFESQVSDSGQDTGSDSDSADSDNPDSDDAGDVETDPDTTSDPCDDCGDAACVDDQCLIPTSCRELSAAGFDGPNGEYLIDPAGNEGEPFLAYCDFSTDGGAGYTLYRHADEQLAGNQQAHRQICAERGLELVVPRTRAHAASIADFNDGQPPSLVGVYRKFPGAAGLHNWEGRCNGQPCQFYLSETNSAGCTESQPTGVAGYDSPLVRVGDQCWFGDWQDVADNTVPLPGSVVCAANDAELPVHKSCLDYLENDAVFNAGPQGISGVYELAPDEGPSYPAYCDMVSHGGGWTLAMKIDGNASTFNYDSELWTNEQLMNPDAPGLDRIQAKLPSFNDQPLTQVMVAMEPSESTAATPQFRRLPLVAEGTSLAKLFGEDNFIATDAGRPAWRAALPNSILQPACNREGFNNRTPDIGDEHNRVRLGILGNENDPPDCNTPDSFIGIGGGGNACGQGNVSAGSIAGCNEDSDRGDGAEPAFATVFVRQVPITESCQALQEQANLGSGIYPINPSGDRPFNAYCEMTLAGGGWTLATINGLNDRPDRWRFNDYPRPGASSYGNISRVITDISRVYSGQDDVQNFSVDAADLFDISAGEVLAYVGGETTDYITTDLPKDCNFFDGDTICADNTYDGLTIATSDDTVITTEGQACTTGANSVENDPYNEFGLHLLAGTATENYHCANASVPLGHGEIGRIYTTFESANGGFWDHGVHSFWDAQAEPNQPGLLLLR